MEKTANQIRGRKAQAWGAYFERYLVSKCQSVGVTITRIPDSCKQVSNFKFIRVRSPFDFVLSYAGRVCFLDTKTTLKDRFAHSQIDSFQVMELFKHNKSGCRGGYLIWFRENNKILFIAASTLNILRTRSGSIKADENYLVFESDDLPFHNGTPTLLFNFDTFDPKKLCLPG